MRVIEIATHTTQKGRNRLHEHGKLWTVIRADKFNNKPAFFTAAIQDGYVRWWVLDETTFREVSR